MEVQLEDKSMSKPELLDDNEALKVWGKKANERAATKKKRAEEERAGVDEAKRKAMVAMKRAENTEASPTKAVEA